MTRFYNETLYKLETAISELESGTDRSIQETESIIHLIVSYLSQVKEYIIKTGFRDSDEEIYFFKHLKPQFVAKLIYYNAIYKIEAKKPYGGKQIVEDYLNKELLRLKSFYDNNIEFCKYYRTDSTYLDHKYFVRGEHDIKLNLDTFYFEIDHSFSTSHDYKVAKNYC